MSIVFVALSQALTFFLVCAGLLVVSENKKLFDVKAKAKEIVRKISGVIH